MIAVIIAGKYKQEFCFSGQIESGRFSITKNCPMTKMY